MDAAEEQYPIGESVIEQVTSALTVAVALATRFEPAVAPRIMAAAVALDVAVNG